MSEQPAASLSEQADRCEACGAPATTRWRSTRIPVCDWHADAGECAACGPSRIRGLRHRVALRRLCAFHAAQVADILLLESLEEGRTTVAGSSGLASWLERAATLPPDDWADIELEPRAAQIRAELAAIERACARAREALARIEAQRRQP